MVSQRTVFPNAIIPIFFLGSAASLQLITSTVYLKNNPDWILIGLSFLVTAGTYLLNKILDKEDQFNNLPRWQFFNGTTGRSYFWISVSFIFLTTPVLIPLLSQKFNVALIFALISITGLFYSVRIIPIFIKNDIQWICFKEIPIIKSIVVCIIWGCGALLLAVADGNVSIFRTDILVIFTVFTISSLNSTITSDVRDIEGDRIRKIHTIPVLIGSRATCKLLSIVNTTGLTAACFLTTRGTISLELGIFSCFIIIWAGLSTLPQYLKPRKLSKTALEILVDSESIVTAIGLGILSILHN